MTSPKNDQAYHVLLQLVVIFGILLLWEILGRLGVLNPLFFPVPSLIFQESITMVMDGEIQDNLSITLFRVFIGFFLGTITGIFIGMVMGASEKVRLLLDPVIAATYPIPKLAIFPLLMVIFGIGEVSKIMAIALGCFFLALINAMAGVLNINKVYFEVAKNYGASKKQMFTKVMLPASLPMIFTGIRIALGMSLLVVVGLEFVSANKGIGAMIWYAWETFEIEKLYVGIFICAILGIIFTVVLQKVEERIVPWVGHTEYTVAEQ
jgi:NitT/TauT family transport system permease protein